MNYIVNLKLERRDKRAKHCFVLLTLFIILISTFNTITIANDDPLPDLTIQSVVLPDTAVEGDQVHIGVLIQNIGNKNVSVGETINMTLLIENIVISTNSTDEGLTAGNSRFINLTWNVELGDNPYQILQIFVDYPQSIVESDENNNDVFRQVEVNERDTDLTFIDDIYLDSRPRVGEPVTIYANTSNIGKNTSKAINATMYIDDNYFESHTIDGLSKGDTYNFSFVWIPESFGITTINVTLDPKNKIEEEDENNNFNETEVTVDASGLIWWDVNWHYRRFYDVKGTGNVSININFTDLLSDLNVNGRKFENDTMTIIKYNTNGDIEGIISNYNFNESEEYNNITNANGTILWEVTESSYYCIYFDVEENRGLRTNTPEIPDMIQFGTAYINFKGSAEGWWIEPIESFRPYYRPDPFTETIDVSMKINTTALAKNVSALFYREDIFDREKKLTSSNNISWYENETFNTSEIGNWTLKIIAYDDAEYRSDLFTHEFYVGSPDLTIERIEFISDLPKNSPFYEGNYITIKTNIIVYYATILNVTVNLSINSEIEDSSTNLTIIKDQDNIIEFDEWFAEDKGTYNITVHVEHEDDDNKANNIFWRILTIEGIPDLGVVNISIPKEPVKEGNPVVVQTIINNTGNGNATNYRMNLYLEQHHNNEMNYEEEVNHTYVDVKVNETKEINLIWNPSLFGHENFDGEWIVGIKILFNISKPDENILNNSKPFFESRVKIIEDTDDPKITIIKPLDYQKFEQGESIQILAEATDNSTIKEVDITIRDPNNINYTGEMMKQGNDIYYYIFNETFLQGDYNISITAIDNSPYEKDSTEYGIFEIVEDATPPSIEYLGAYPSVQLPGEYVTINCITTDLTGLFSVKVTITYPENHSESFIMTNLSENEKYFYRTTYQTIGKYIFYIRAEDSIGNVRISETKEFWITHDLDDRDNDGMPDWWEEQYGFDPYDPSDADLDEDDDGYTNVEEFKNGTNPLKSFSLLQTVVFIMKKNFEYLTASGILLLIIIVLAIYGMRRLKK